jgi:hypothetical protein
MQTGHYTRNKINCVFDYVSAVIENISSRNKNDLPDKINEGSNKLHELLDLIDTLT